MNDIIFNITPAQWPTIRMLIHILGGIPHNSSLIGSFSGVVLAYILARLTERYFNVQKRAKWLEMVREELIQANSGLDDHERVNKVFFAIHNELLKSLMVSGDLSLFTANEAIALSVIYTNTDNYVKNIEMINKRMKQIKYLVNPENPNYLSLVQKWDDLREKQKKGEESLTIKEELEKVNDEIRVLETYSGINKEIESESGIDDVKRMKSIIEAILKQEWFNDKRWHPLIPKHMRGSDEKMLKDLTKIPLVPGRL